MTIARWLDRELQGPVSRRHVPVVALLLVSFAFALSDDPECRSSSYRLAMLRSVDRWARRDAAAFYIRHVGSADDAEIANAVPRLLALTLDAEPLVRINALRAVGRIGMDQRIGCDPDLASRMLRALVRATQDPEPTQRLAAFEAITEFCSGYDCSNVAPVLLQRPDDAAALRALGSVASPDDRRVIELLEERENHELLGTAARHALDRIRGRRRNGEQRCEARWPS